jgi:hypothetical protein
MTTCRSGEVASRFPSSLPLLFKYGHFIVIKEAGAVILNSTANQP